MGDVMVFPLKMLGYSLNSVDRSELDEARTILLDVAPHLLALDSDKYGQKMADGEAALTLGWTGPLGQELEGHAGQGLRHPERGHALLARHLGHDGRTRRIRTRSYAWLDFIHRPDVQARGDRTTTSTRRRTTRRKPFVEPELLADPAVFPPEDVIAKLEPAQDTSGNTQRIDIWEEFKSKIGG